MCVCVSYPVLLFKHHVLPCRHSPVLALLRNMHCAMLFQLCQHADTDVLLGV